jgi:aerobic carbon-monoxide dehydrogenase small subunit
VTVSFILNRVQVSVDTPAGTRLADLLREQCELPGCRAGCYAGECGACTIYYNGELAYSCLIPAFAAQNAEIITLEGLAGTQELRDIEKGLQEAAYTPCINCRQSKILTIHALLESNPVPEKTEIDSALNGHSCGCTDMRTLHSVINACVTFRRTRRNAGR